MFRRRSKPETVLERLPLSALGMFALRSWAGLNYLASFTSRPVKAGFAPAELTPAARFFASVFAAREFLMVAMVVRAAAADRATLRDALRASAAVDAFDTVASTALALSPTGSRKGAVTSAVTGALSGVLAEAAARRV